MKKITLTLVFLLGSLSLLFGQTYTMTDGSNNSYNTCSGTFVDSGGAGTGNPSQYTNSESSVITFCPSTPGDLIQINFSQFETEAIGATLYDFLEYWNANSNAGPADGVYGGALGAFSITSTSPDGCITFEFTSDLTSRDLGWEAVVSCVTPCTVPIANLDSTPVDICGPASINPGSLTVAFDASGSTANVPETVASYEWDFGDGNTQITATSSVNHTYASIEGIYLASVDVVDTNGCRSTNAVTKLVRVMPGPDFSGVPLTYNVACGSSISLTGVVSSQTETQETPVVVGGTVALPDGSGVSYTSSLDFTGFFPNSGPGSTVASGCYPTLTFDLEHSFSGDLEISLISPTGETVMVYDQHGGGTGFGNCVDGADDNVPGCTATYTVVASGGTDDWTTATQLGAPPTVNGTCAYTGVCEIGDYYDPSLIYNSTNPFSSLDGADLNGSWTLQITDNIGFDDGVIDTWSLTFPASCYTTLETVTPDLVTATWTGGGAVPVGAQSTTSAVVTDPGPDLCPGSATCQGTELTNSPTVGPFAIAGPYTYTLTVVDEFGCEYERDVVVTASCDCLITLDTANNTQAVCENTAIADIEYTVGGDATGATVTGLPAGITGSFSAGVFTISGTPNLGVSGVFNYTVTTVGCTPNLSETGTITINAFPIADAGTDGTITCTTTSIQIGAA
ncbi:PKD domain-containing protein, partial [Aurantibacter sp.]|uniref:PKD domain-containing protein n=1 Tax=Aurantibacter sp. TaxID=2807103 RepID=UPI0035C7EA98